MALGSSNVGENARATGWADVYLASRVELGIEDAFDAAAARLALGDRAVTAVGPHADDDELLYLTTGSPQTLELVAADVWPLADYA